MKNTIALFSLLSFVFVAPAYAEGDPELENALLYRNGYASTLVKSPQTLPFYLLVSKEGTGYLVDFPPDPDPLTAVRLEENGTPSSWDYTLGKLDEFTRWKKLRDTDAKTIWGNATGHATAGSYKPSFYTFDAPGSFNKENNIYHIDFRFDPTTGYPFQYRVRGIGITNPQFIPGPPTKKQ